VSLCSPGNFFRSVLGSLLLPRSPPLLPPVALTCPRSCCPQSLVPPQQFVADSFAFRPTLVFPLRFLTPCHLTQTPFRGRNRPSFPKVEDGNKMLSLFSVRSRFPARLASFFLLFIFFYPFPASVFDPAIVRVPRIF